MKIIEKQKAFTLVGNAFDQFGKQVLMTQINYDHLAILAGMEELQSKADPMKVDQEKENILEKMRQNEKLHYTPFIISARGTIKSRGDDWEIQQNAGLHILDGRKRILGFQAALDDLTEKMEKAVQENKPRIVKKLQTEIKKLHSFPIPLQIYLDLSSAEESKLFNDTHHIQRREIQSWVMMQYDQRDYLTTLSRKLAKTFEQRMEIEQKCSRVTDQSSALTSLMTIKKCLLAMWDGELTGKDASNTNAMVYTQTAEKRSGEFLETWLQLFPNNASNRVQYVTGLSGIQIALAYSVYLLTDKGKLPYREATKRLAALTCTWKHEDPLFSHLYDSTTGRIKKTLTKKMIEETAQQFVNEIERRERRR